MALQRYQSACGYPRTKVVRSLQHWVHKPALTLLLDGTKTSYFRGRKLRGKAIKIPKGYKGPKPRSQRLLANAIDNGAGIAVSKSNETKLSRLNPWMPADAPESVDDDDGESPPEPIKILKEEAQFDSITVWGHDRLPTADDPFCRGIAEWISLAQAVSVNRYGFTTSLPTLRR